MPIITDSVASVGSSVNPRYIISPFDSNVSIKSSIVWTNHENVKLENGQFVTFSFDDNDKSNSPGLLITNFKSMSNIPDSAIIDGIEVKIKKRQGAGNTDITDNHIRLVKAPGPINKELADLSLAWSTTNEFVSYGGPTEKHNETWNVNDLKNSKFGVAISVTALTGQGNVADIDTCIIEVYYHYNSTEETRILNNHILAPSKILFGKGGEKISTNSFFIRWEKK